MPWTARSRWLEYAELDEIHQFVAKFYSYGSEKKATATVYRRNRAIRLEPQDFKDPKIESDVINSMLVAGKIKVTAKALARGKYVTSTANHPDVADAFSSSFFGYFNATRSAHQGPTTDAEGETAALEKIKASRPRPATVTTAADVIYGKAPTDKAKSHGPPGNPYGLPR